MCTKGRQHAACNLQPANYTIQFSCHYWDSVVREFKMADPGRNLNGMHNQPFLAPNNGVFNQKKHISIFYNVAPHLTSYRFLTYSSKVWHDLVVTKTAISSTPLEGNQIVFIVSLYLYRFCSCKVILMFLFLRLQNVIILAFLDSQF